jgi:O-antigen/teichoic acid export membrane protein
MFSVAQAFLVPLVGLMTKAGITARFFRHADDLPTFVTTCLALLSASSCLVLLAMWPAREAIAVVMQVPVGWLFVAVLAAAAQFTILICLALWQARREAFRFGAFQVLHAATNVGLSLVLVVAVRLGWEGRALGQVAALVLFAAVALIVLARERQLGWPPRAAHAREALAFGVPLIPHGLSAATLGLADRLLITNLASLEQAGLYTSALQIAMMLGLLIQAFNRAYTPWLFAELARNDPQRGAVLVRGSYVYFAALAGLAGAIGLASPFIGEVLLGEQFRPAAAFIPLLVAGVAIGGMHNLVANYLIVARRTGWLSIATVCSGATNIAALIMLVQRNGALGAAQAFLLSQLVLFLTTWWFASKAYPMPWARALFSSKQVTARDARAAATEAERP